ncbi:uncharacterized protein HRG_06768 [Hirsutella rhossiliensis]|uniref:Uncharacterized protein n=1 Tax=Hirsutella rhossiliensis TaxID=111463 RepID=A0A9P8MYK9_9HYPO|nr:uncharacterized protein HRG_06768 [Hirsutella rhossiliensis]KAH0962666.1 hypothetical protein HRG_06768 [Hirsutella rhossiliensis]
MSNAIEDPRVRAAIEHYLLDLENTQPKNTKRNYRPKQEEWKEWCQANWPAIPDVWPASVPQGQQLPGDLVDEGKLLLFMKEVVASRPPKKGKRVADERKRHLEAQEAKRAVKRRRAPSDTIVVGGGGSEYESDSDLELYESTLKLQYNTIPDHTNVAWSEREIACALRTQVDFLLGNHMLLRSGNRLPMEKGGKVSVFQRSEDWYETKVLRRSAKEPQAPLSGQTAREWTSRFYKRPASRSPRSATRLEWPRRKTPTWPEWMKARSAEPVVGITETK